METTGDIQNNLYKLKSYVQRIQFQGAIDFKSIQEGDPRPLLAILHYAILDYSYDFSNELTNKGYQLFGKSDQRFLEGVFRILCNEFHTKPSMTVSQFLSKHFTERKIILTLTIIRFIYQKQLESTKLKKQAQTRWRKPSSNVEKKFSSSWTHFNLGNTSQHSNIFPPETNEEDNKKNPNLDHFTSVNKDTSIPQWSDQIFEEEKDNDDNHIEDVSISISLNDSDNENNQQKETEIHKMHISMLKNPPIPQTHPRESLESSIKSTSTENLSSIMNHSQVNDKFKQTNLQMEQLMKSCEQIVSQVENVSNIITNRFSKIENRLLTLELFMKKYEEKENDSLKKSHLNSILHPNSTHFIQEQHKLNISSSSSSCSSKLSQKLSTSQLSQWPPRRPKQ